MDAEILQDRIDKLEDALYRIAQWADAYPLTVFPEPDFDRVRAVLSAAGMTVDAISASAMRHLFSPVGERTYATCLKKYT